MQTALSQSVGYGVVVGVGMLFAVGMVGTTAALRRYQREVITSEEFATAGRSVNSGLIACAVVSAWTWAATLLQSTTQVYQDGLSGGFYYAAGATAQILLFAMCAIEVKKKAPAAHTYLEVVRFRYQSPVAHGIYIFFALATNILVTAMLLAGGSATISDLTGMSPIAAIFLLPLGVTLYTLFGGLKATFLTDYVHTVILLIIILIFALTTFASSDIIGSPGKLWDMLTELAKTKPVDGNAGGSYMTMRSKAGGIFYVINIAGNFGTVFLDQAYWSRGLASSPEAVLPGYLLGGFAWFPVPWLTSTTLGLAGLVLKDKYFPDVTAAEISAGLTLPNAAAALMGSGGAAASLLMVFMAVTSATSAELVAVSTVISYDVYKTYINPKATQKQLMVVTHASVVAFALIMCGFSVGLHYAGISMGYLYDMMGILISANVLPSVLTIYWKGLSTQAACLAPILGLCFSIASWLGSAKGLLGAVNVSTTGANMPSLIGNVVAVCSPLVTIPVLTLIFKPANYNFEDLKSFKSVHDVIPEDLTPEAAAALEEKERAKLENGDAVLQKYSKIATILCPILAFCLLVMWPMPMYGTGYIFSKKFFTGWIVVGIMWIFFAVFAVVILPLWQGRIAIYDTLRGMYWDATGQGHKLRIWQNQHPELLHESFAPGSDEESQVVPEKIQAEAKQE